MLKTAEIPVKVIGARETTHSKLNADLGLPDDPSSKELLEFVDKTVKNQDALHLARSPSTESDRRPYGRNEP